MPTLNQLLSHPSGLLLLAGPNPEVARHALWEALGEACESLYLIGPLSKKPELPSAQARIWLLECGLEERCGGVRRVLRLDAHGIHAIGPVTAELFELLVNASLSGSTCVAELEAENAAAALEAARGLGEQARFLPNVLLGVVTSGARGVEVWGVDERARKALAENVPASDIVAPG